MWRVYIQNHPSLGPWYRRMESRPGWVWRGAVAAAVIVFVVPLVLLALAAMVIAAAVFVVLSLTAAGLGTVRRLFGGHGLPRDDGRRNVRIIHR